MYGFILLSVLRSISLLDGLHDGIWLQERRNNDVNGTGRRGRPSMRRQRRDEGLPEPLDR